MNEAVIYARVSSTGDRQSTERQVADLTRYASTAGLKVVKIYEEKASGAKLDREQLVACLEFLRGGGVLPVDKNRSEDKEGIMIIAVVL